MNSPVLFQTRTEWAASFYALNMYVTSQQHNQRPPLPSKTKFWAFVCVCLLHTALASEETLKRETSIFFYYCPAHHYVFYCWGDECAEEQRRLTVVLPSPDLIGWSHQTTAAESCGMNKCAPRWCNIFWNAWHFIYLSLLLLLFLEKREVSVNMHRAFNNKWAMCNGSCWLRQMETLPRQYNLPSVANNFSWVKAKSALLHWVQSVTAT